jgi:hypothetical protein
MVANHEHLGRWSVHENIREIRVPYVQMFVEGVVRVRPGGVRRRRKHIIESTHDDDVRSVTATCG